MIPPGFQIRIAYNPAWACYDVYLIGRNTPNGQEFISPVEWKGIEALEGGVIPEPAFRITREQAEVFMEQLSGHGVKPPDVSLAEGKLEATERHLQDLRTLLKLRKANG